MTMLSPSSGMPAYALSAVGAYPTRQCVFRSYLDAHPVYADHPRDPVDIGTQRRGEAGLAFEAAVLDSIRRRAADGEFTFVDLTTVSDTPNPHEPGAAGEITRATRQAMLDRVDVIAGGSIRATTGVRIVTSRDDPLCQLLAGSDGPSHRVRPVRLTGRPDLLLYDSEWDLYRPVDVKHHKAKTGNKRGTPARLGVLGAPLDFDAMPESLCFDAGRRRSDGLQLAHYLRILGHLQERHGRAGIIGSDCFDMTDPDSPIEIVWHDLGVPPAQTPGPGFDQRRVEYAEWAASKTPYWEHGRALSGVALARLRGMAAVEPSSPHEALLWGRVGKGECASCERHSLCAELAGAQDPSFAFTVGRPNAGGWAYLYAAGADTIDALAALDPATHQDAFEAAQREVNNRAHLRLDEVVLRAALIRDGVSLKKRTVPRTPDRRLNHRLPRADVEIDFDVEWGDDGHVYQWGALLRRRQPDGSWSAPDYDSLTRLSFDPLDVDAATALGDDFFRNLHDFVQRELSAGNIVQIYHWTHPEKSKSKDLLGRIETQFANTFDELLPNLRTDLKKWVEDGWWSVHGYSIKVVAPACGFTWDVDDPGGALSMVKIEQCRAREGDWQAAEAWLRAYNRSDCAAQAAIRDALSE